MAGPRPGARLAVDAAWSGGAYEVFETRLARGDGPGLHVHEGRDELFVVLAGRVRFQLGTEVVEGGAGTRCGAPRGRPHRFEATRDRSRMLFIVSPPGLAPYFEEMAELAARGVTGAVARGQLARRHDAHPVEDALATGGTGS